jgi:hypothetical protein
LPTSSWAMERREEQGEVDVSRSEGVEHELNRLIERRHDQRAAEEWHRPSEELWQQSVERYNAERDRQLKTEWVEYHQGQAERHRAVLKGLIAHHEEQAEKFMDIQRKEQRNGQGEIRQRLPGQGGHTPAYEIP